MGPKGERETLGFGEAERQGWQTRAFGAQVREGRPRALDPYVDLRILRPGVIGGRAGDTTTSMKAWTICSLAWGMLGAGGCLGAETISPACPNAEVRTVSEAEAPEAYEILGTAHAQVGVVQSHTADFADAVLQLDVVEIDDVEYVERSPACVSDVGFRARALVDVHAADGSLSARVPALVDVDSEHEFVRIAFLEAEIELLGDAQIPQPDATEGATVGGVALEVGDGEITLMRIDMAASCTSLATCSATSRVPIVSWNHADPDFDTWFDEVGP
jgi:hypothetical protein